MDLIRLLSEAGVLDAVTALSATIALIVALWIYHNSRAFTLLDHVHRLTDRLYEMNLLVIESPELQQFLYRQASRVEPYFVPATVHDRMYFRVKTFIYLHINFYEEIILSVVDNEALAEKFGFENWRDYIVLKMRHPLFHELYFEESKSWDDKFMEFVEKNITEIDKTLTAEEREKY